MSNSTFNTFAALNTDTHPLNTKNDVMVDAINAALTTDGSNQLILQNMKGTDLFSALPDGYRPLGIAIHENIAYIISGSFNDDGSFISGEIGTFPSPDWAAINNSQNPEKYFLLKNEYSAIKNFLSNPNATANQLASDLNHISPFRTNKLDFQSDRLIEVEIQPSYDESVNIIFTDDFNPIRLVNSRFKLHEDGKRAAIANRRQDKDTNTYSNVDFDSTRLIKSSNIVPKLTFDGVFPGGAHTGGGRRFYFRYIDSDGTLTDVIEESRLVVFAYDNIGASGEENTGKLVKFTFDNLDTKFSGIKVYYSLGEDLVTPNTLVYEIRDIYDITSSSKSITIYGNEDKDLYDADRLSLSYSAIGTVKTITQYDDRLILGNLTSNLNDYEYLKSKALQLRIQEQEEELIIKGLGEGYANPNNVYNKLGYWAGETYETAIVFIMNDGTLSPALPVRGGDNYDGNFVYTSNNNFQSDGFKQNSSENRLGVYRTKATRTMLRNELGVSDEFVADRTDIKYFNIDISSLIADTIVQEETKGFFFVRKERKRDCVVQGFTTNTTRVPVNQKISSTGRYDFDTAGSEWDDNESIYIQDVDGHLGNLNQDPTLQFKIIPAPGRIGEITKDSVGDITKETPISKQGWVTPNQDWNYANSNQQEFFNSKPELYWAFYSADQLADPAIMATTFSGGQKGILANINADPIRANSIVDGSAVINTDQLISNVSIGNLPTVNSTFVSSGEGEFNNDIEITLISSSSTTQVFLLKTQWRFDPGGVFTGSKKMDIEFHIVVDSSDAIQSSFGFIESNNADDNQDWNFDYIPSISGTFPFIKSTDTVGYLTGSPTIDIKFGYTSGIHMKKNNNNPVGINAYNYKSSDSINPYLKIDNDPVLSTQTSVVTTKQDPIKILNLDKFNSNLSKSYLKPNNKYYFNYISYNQDAFGSRQFSAVEDRNLYYVAATNWSNNLSAPDWSFSGHPSTGVGVAKDLFSGNTQFSEYIGFSSELGDDAFLNVLNNDDFPVNNYSIEGLNTVNFTGNGLNDYVKQVQFDGFNLAVLTNIYDSIDGPASTAVWKNKYNSLSSQEAYYAITNRYSWAEAANNTNLSLYSGDCYIAHVYKRIMLGLGIPGLESDTVSDPGAYTVANQSTGLSAKGFVMPIVTENNYNVNLRIDDKSSASELLVYGEGRKFYPVKTIDSLRSSRQKESTAYNFGYNDNTHDKFYVSLNDRSPVFNLDYSNRVMVSELSVSGSFSNGYLDFSGLNFKDYNRQFGQITKLITHNNNVYCIFEQGVGVLPINQKTMMSEQDGGVFIDNAEVLAPKMQVISTEYGSDQQFSIIKTDQAIYGCDLRKNRIWRVGGSNGQYGLDIISDFAVQTVIKEYKERINTSNARNYVKANYDRERNDVVFSYMNLENGKFTTNYLGDCNETKTETIINGNPFTTIDGNTFIDTPINTLYPSQTPLYEDLERPYYPGTIDPTDPNYTPEIKKSKGVYEKICKVNKIASIYWNETLGKWISKLSWNPLWLFNIENQLYSFNAIADRNNIWKHFSKSVPYSYIYNNQEQFIFEFILVDKSAIQKVINNLMVISNRAFPGRVTYTLLENDFDYDSLNDNTNNSFVEKLKQRTEYKPTVGWNISTSVLNTVAVFSVAGMSEQESERLVGGYIVYPALPLPGSIYIIGKKVQDPNGLFYNEILDQNGNNIGAAPAGFTFEEIQFGIIQQNMEYIEDHLYIEVGKNDNGVDIRDKAIKIKFTYEGYDYVTIQAILSSFVYSFN